MDTALKSSSDATRRPDGMKKKKKKKEFMRSLAAELVGDGSFTFSSSRLLSMSAAELKEFFLHMVAVLPCHHNHDDKKRSTFLHHYLEHPHFIAALQEAIRDCSPPDTLKNRLLDKLSAWLTDHKFFSFMSSSLLLSSVKNSVPQEKELKEENSRTQFPVLHLRQQPHYSPPAHVIWSMAALELINLPPLVSEKDNHSAEAARVLLTCLKPLIVGHTSSSTAILGFAPLVPVFMNSLQQCSSSTVTIDRVKLLLSIAREVLGFISVVSNKDKQEGMDELEKLSVTDLRDGFSFIFEALNTKVNIEKRETQLEAGVLKLMFPLVSTEFTEELEKSQIAEVGTLAEAVKIHFVLLQMILEVIYRRENTLTRDKSKKPYIEELSRTMGTVAVNGLAVVDKGKDLILDALLSNSCACDILDGQEIELIHFLLYKALLISGKAGLVENVLSEATESKIHMFFKKIMVARKMAFEKRLKGESQNNVEELARNINVPYGLVEKLKSGQTTTKVSENILQSDRALIGWLLQLGETELQGLVEVNFGHSSQSMKGKTMKRLETDGLEYPLDLGVTFREAESLFFLDTTGENEDKAGEGSLKSVSNVCTSEGKSCKRKKRQVLFQRHGQLMNKEEKENKADTNEEDDEILTNSSSDEMVSIAEGSRLKRYKEDLALAS